MPAKRKLSLLTKKKVYEKMSKKEIFQTVSKIISSSGRVRETKRLPDWNPQEEFTSDEENNGFQGFFADGTRLFIPLFELVEILISTKGVDKVDTLIRGLYQNQKNRWKVLNLQPASSFQSTNRNFCVV